VIDTPNVPHITVSPRSFRLGPSDSTVQTLTICNTGIRDTLQYTIDSVAGGRVVADTSTGRLASSACRNVTLTFNRSGLPLGNTIFNLVVRHNAWLDTNPVSVPCTLTVDSASVPHIALNPVSYRIEPTDTSIQTLQICNTGTADTLQYTINSVAGRIVPDTAAGRLGAGDCRNVQLTFDRSGLLPGENVFQFTVSHNSPLSLSPLSVPCTLVVDSASVPHIALTPGSFTVGPAYPAVQTLQICNSGTLDTLHYSLNLGSGGILINEVCNSIDYIELLNTGLTDVNIGGWRLVWTDNTTTSGSYTIPAGTIIRSRRCVLFRELTGTSSDSVIYIGNSLGWVSTTQLSVSLLNSSGTGVDFFKTSGDATTPPAGTSWPGAGVTAGDVTYYRNTTTDNNTAADWLGSSSYTLCLPNPGQTFSGGSGGLISADTATGSVAAGECRNVQLTFERTGLLPGQNVFQFIVSHNSPLSPNPLAVQCTLVVDPASVPHIALTPGYFRIEPADTNVQTLQICNAGSEDTLQYTIDTVAGGRVVADTATGLLSAGACRNVQLTFNRSGLLPGSYLFPLTVHHNGPLEPDPMSVPCTLVVDSTTMAYSIPSMAVTIYTGDTAMRYVTLQNTGASILDDTLITVPRSAVMINEVNNYLDCVELLNTGNTDVNIGGYRLLWTDNSGSSGSYTIPSGTIIDARSCLMLSEGAGTGSDSVIYMGNILGWRENTELSVSLLNSSGRGVDFFKTSGDATSPPAGTTWTGSGVTAGYYAYRRSSLTDNNTAADWTGASSSADYTYCLPNPGQNLRISHISAAQDSFYINPGQTTIVRFKYDASTLMTGGFYTDTFQIIQNSKNVVSPIDVICSLTVISNYITLVPVSPDPTVNRQPTLAWHPVVSASSYTVEASLTPSFSTLEFSQLTADTSFSPLSLLPLGTIYWRVRSDLGVRYSLPDTFFIQNDSIPLLIPIVPDTISQQPSMLFTWHPATGATSYRIMLYDIEVATPDTIFITEVTDSFYLYALTLPTARYQWTVSADFDYSQTAYPDTFWVNASPVLPGEKQRLLPTAYGIKALAGAGHMKILCAIPQQKAGVAGVAIDLYDIRGRLVRMLYSGTLAAGYHHLSIRTGAMASGIYYCRMRAGGIQKVAAVHLMR
jgi:hypothetical protein